MSSDRPAAPRIAALLAAAAIGGCARPPGVVFPPLDQPLVWPPPPEAPRIEYVGELVTDTDLEPARSFGKAVSETFFGESPARSMLTPYGVCTDGGDRLFVTDSNAQVVHVFDLESRVYERWPAGDEARPLAQPMGVAWDAVGARLVVADAAAGELVVLRDGAVIRTLGREVLERPVGVALNPSADRLYVADTAADQVVVLDAGGAVVHRLGGRGTGPGQFHSPWTVALDAQGRLYVADTLNWRVQVFDPALEPVLQIGSHGDRPGYFSLPKGIAIDGDGHLYVVDAQFEAVQVFDPQGRLLLSFGREGNGPGEFWLPAGIHIDPTDRIWIADSFNRRVQVFRYLPDAEATAP